MAAAVRVFCDVCDDVESVAVEQTMVLGRCKAAVIERLAMKGANGFAMAWPTRKQECCGWRGVLSEDREHPALILRSEMKETVPSEETIKSLAESKRSHINHKPAGVRKSPLADLDHRRRGIDARQRISTIDKKATNRLGGSTANIKNAATQSDERQKTFEPCSFEQLVWPFPVPRLGIPIVKIDDVFCVVGHPSHVVPVYGAFLVRFSTLCPDDHFAEKRQPRWK
jgi:hypothetical protein